VKLLAASKGHPPSALRAAYQAGIRIFGENYVQEGLGKRTQLNDLTDAQWHLIGHLQRNKARLALDCFDLIHSLDSYQLAERLWRLRPEPKPEVLIEVNLGAEPTKSGVLLSEVEGLLEKVRELVVVRGLMTIPPPGATPEHSRLYFAQLRELRDKLTLTTGLALEELSMGMSRDFEVAIEEGATIVRIGEAIFGARPR